MNLLHWQHGFAEELASGSFLQTTELLSAEHVEIVGPSRSALPGDREVSGRSRGRDASAAAAAAAPRTVVQPSIKFEFKDCAGVISTVAFEEATMASGLVELEEDEERLRDSSSTGQELLSSLAMAASRMVFPAAWLGKKDVLEEESAVDCARTC